METNNEYRLVPGYSNSFGTGWRVMTDNFLRLFLVIIILAIVSAPLKFLTSILICQIYIDLHVSMMDDLGNNMNRLFALGSLGVFAAFFGLMALLYAFLLNRI